MNALIVFVTAPTRREATRLAKTLIKEKLAACVNIVPGLESHYTWKGKMERASELLLIMKTTKRRYPALQKRIQALHSYSVPEILAIPVAQGSADYLSWLEAFVR